MNNFRASYTKFMDFCSKNFLQINAWGFFILGNYITILLSCKPNEVYLASHFCLAIWTSSICISAPLLYGRFAQRIKFRAKWQAVIYWIVFGIIAQLIVPLLYAIKINLPLAFARVACLTLFLNLHNIPSIVKKDYPNPRNDDQNIKS